MPREPRKDGTGYRSSQEESFHKAWEEYGFPGSDLAREYVFSESRNWRFDFAWPSLKVAVEVNGFRDHGTIRGMIRDAEKTRDAIFAGWLVIPFTSGCISSQEKRYDAVLFVCDILSKRAQEAQYGQQK